ncbi:hypothetical protein D3C86_1758570 [compost metagenome]
MYRLPTIVEIFGLKKPVPITVKDIPRKKNLCGSAARIRLPIIISIPPQNNDFLNPNILSANKPPMKVKA